jgi:hypothetical protein
MPDVAQEDIEYRGWHIYRNSFTAHHRWRKVMWCYVHKDYDGPEDNRSGACATVYACKSEIDAYEEEHADG